MSKKYIEGVVTLIEPANIAEPGGARVSDDGKILYGNNGRPLTRTIRTETILATDGESIISPFDGGNNIRGKLRRAASEVIFNALEEKGQTIKKETYSGMTSGAVSAQPKTDKLLLSESKAANQHIFFGLFGGGPRLLPSAYQAYPLLPILKSFIDNNIMPVRFDEVAVDYKSLRDMTEIIYFIRRDDVLQFTATNPDCIEDYDNAVESAQQAVMENKSKRKAAKDDDSVTVKKTDLSNMGALEVIKRGTPLRFRVDFKSGVTDEQIGLMLMAVKSYAQDNIGGWGRIGLGQHKMDLQLFDGNKCLGDVLEYDNNEVKISDDMIDYLDAAHNAIDKITSEELNGFMSEEGYYAPETA